MTEFTDRLVMLIIAATGLAVLVLGWTGGLIEAELEGTTETVLLAGVGLLFLGLLIAVWIEFSRID